MNAQIQAVFRRRKLTYTLLIAAVVGIYFFASAITKFHLTEGILSFPKAFVWIGENLIPDELAIRRFPKILDKLLETVLLSVAVTVIAAAAACCTDSRQAEQERKNQGRGSQPECSRPEDSGERAAVSDRLCILVF